MTSAQPVSMLLNHLAACFITGWNLMDYWFYLQDPLVGHLKTLMNESWRFQKGTHIFLSKIYYTANVICNKSGYCSIWFSDLHHNSAFQLYLKRNVIMTDYFFFMNCMFCRFLFI